MKNFDLKIFSCSTSGVAKLGHTGARAPATRGRAPPVQCACQLSVPIVLLSIANQAAKNP